MLTLRMKQALEQQYHHYRKEALSIASEMLLLDNTGISLQLVDAVTYEAFLQWQYHHQRYKVWDWPYTFQQWKMHYPKRFEVAAWKEGKLVGLSLGRPTYASTGLRLDFIEKAPDARNVKLLDAVYIALRAYAAALGANHIKIMHPVNSEVREYYVSKGFAYDRKQDCCIRRLW